MTKKLLVTPLDWGLGHATRCMPLIRMLLHWGHEVFIAGSGPSLLLLKLEFPSLPFFELPGYNPSYPASGSMPLSMLKQLPHFVSVIRLERQQVSQLVKEHHIDIVFSDNRYGAWSKDSLNVFITHQSNILMPRRFGWLAPMIRRINKKLAKPYDYCVVPDQEGKSLAGDLLSFGDGSYHSNMRYTGFLSRFSSVGEEGKIYDVVAMCSGPEPQRSILENLFRTSLAESKLSFLLVRGVLTGTEEVRPLSGGFVCDYLTSGPLERILRAAGLVLCRSGYSTVMDLTVLKKKAVFVPTPGQTEQEYLASKLKAEGVAYYIPQEQFDLNEALSCAVDYSGFTATVVPNQGLAGVLREMGIEGKGQ